jgi:predicted porin
VAGAIFAAASAAQAGIIIPAGDWTLDINGNVNAFANYTSVDAVSGTKGADATNSTFIAVGRNAGNNANKAIGINTGLLPSWLGFTGKTRQNDLDVEFTMSLQPNVSDNSAAGDNKTPLFRQTYLSFGDKSWGSIKLGKDIGIFASDAILNDMTLLGVGGGAGLSGAATTLGGIGSGYIYAAWKGQIAYTTPNMNGFQATVGITNPNQLAVVTGNQDRYGFEGKASYSFAANDVTGKIWVSGATYDASTASVTTVAGVAGDAAVTAVGYVAASAASARTISVGDIGATLSAAGFTATGYYYQGKGAGTTLLGNLGWNGANKRDSDGGYVQLSYVLPTKTKIGVAYGISNLDRGNGETAGSVTNLVSENERITVGAYHPLTKHLNLVAEYNNIESKAHNNNSNESKTYSAGAILFF